MIYVMDTIRRIASQKAFHWKVSSDKTRTKLAYQHVLYELVACKRKARITNYAAKLVYLIERSAQITKLANLQNALKIVSSEPRRIKTCLKSSRWERPDSLGNRTKQIKRRNFSSERPASEVRVKEKGNESDTKNQRLSVSAYQSERSSQIGIHETSRSGSAGLAIESANYKTLFWQCRAAIKRAYKILAESLAQDALCTSLGRLT